MAFLESLASGLRGAGAVLSPDVYGNQVQDERIRQAQLERRNTLYAQQVIKGVEDGAITPEAGRAALTRLGLPDVPMGLSVAAQARQEDVVKRREALEQERIFRSEIAALPAEERTDPAVLGGVFLKHGKSEVGARLIDQAEQRIQRAQQFTMDQQRRADELGARMENQSLDRASREQLARERNDTLAAIARGHDETRRMTAALGRALSAGKMELVDDQQGNKVWVDPRNPNARAIPALGPDGQPLKGKPTINQQELLKFSTAMDKAGFPEAQANLDEAKSKINPEVLPYLTGPKGAIPDVLLSKQVTDARQALQRLLNITLKDRSGAAVTVPEWERFKKEAGIGILKKPEQVAEFLSQAQTIIDKHYRGIAAGYSDSVREGYFEALGKATNSGETFKPSGPAPAAPVGGGWSIKRKE